MARTALTRESGSGTGSGLDDLVSMVEHIKKRGDVLLLGVTGGIACGKSTVADLLAELGAPMIDFDVLAREVVEPGRPAFEDIVTCFGPEVLAADGSIDRKALSARVFADSNLRKRLEAFTHVRIMETFLEKLKGLTQERSGLVVQLVIPLLYEAHLEYLCHRILVVYVPAEIQIERLVERDGISREHAGNILRAQMSIEEKKARADFVIDNQGDIEETGRQVQAFWMEIREKIKGPPGG